VKNRLETLTGIVVGARARNRRGNGKKEKGKRKKGQEPMNDEEDKIVLGY
jgi:hypothetical protein